MANNTVTQQKKKVSAKKKKTKYIVAIILSVIFLTAVYFSAVMTGGIDIDEDNTPTNIIEDSNEDIDVASSALVRKDGFYNFLVIGTDKVGSNTDTILLVSYDTKNAKINILQIPRDTRIITTRNNKKINAAYAYEGIDGLEEDVQDLLGVPVDRYAVVSTSAFRAVVNAIDGVEVTVPEPGFDYDDPDQDLYIHLKAGTQVLYGEDAEGFVRYRYGYADADLGRIKAQRAFMASFVEKLLSPSVITKAPQLIKIAFDNVKTDMEFNDFLYLGTQATSLNSDSISFFSAPGEGVGADFGLYKEETIEMINAYFNPYTTDITEDRFDITEYDRQLTGDIDISGTTADNAVDTKLSRVTRVQGSDSDEDATDSDTDTDTNNPSDTGDTDNDGDTDNSGSGINNEETPEDTDTGTPGGDASDTPAVSSNTIQIELINTTDDESVLSTYVAKFKNAGFNVVKSSTNSSLSYEKTAIIIQTDGDYVNAVKGYLPTSYIIENYLDNPSCDIIIILGDNAK